VNISYYMVTENDSEHGMRGISFSKIRGGKLNRRKVWLRIRKRDQRQSQEEARGVQAEHIPGGKALARRSGGGVGV